MGYTTEFSGAVTVEPPLNSDEVAFLTELAETRRMARGKGPYFVKGSGDFGQGHDPDLIDYNYPSGGSGISWKPLPSAPGDGTPAAQPGLWCQWAPDDEGHEIAWDGGEKFYSPVEWMRYIIDNFLSPGAYASTPEGQALSTLADETDRFSRFTFDHVCNGTIEAQGEDSDDRWRLVVTNNTVKEQRARIVYDETED